MKLKLKQRDYLEWVLKNFVVPDVDRTSINTILKRGWYPDIEKPMLNKIRTWFVHTWVLYKKINDTKL